MVFAHAPGEPAPAPQAGTALAGLFTRFLSALLGPDLPDIGRIAGSPAVAEQTPAEAGDDGDDSPAEGRPTAATLPAAPPDAVASGAVRDEEAPRAPDATGTAGGEAAAPEGTVTVTTVVFQNVAPHAGTWQATGRPGRQPSGGRSEAASPGVTADRPAPFAMPNRSVSPGPRLCQRAAGVTFVLSAAQPQRSLLASPGTENVVSVPQVGVAAAVLSRQAGETQPGASSPQETTGPALTGASAKATQTGQAHLQPPVQGRSLLPDGEAGATTRPPAAGEAQSPAQTPGRGIAPGNRAAPTDGTPDAGQKAPPAQNKQPLSPADAGPLLLQAGRGNGIGTAAGREIPDGPQGAMQQATAGVPGPRAGLENVAEDRFRGTPTGARENGVTGPLNSPAPVTAATPPAGRQPLTAQIAVAVVRHIEQLQQQPGRPFRIELALEPPELGRVTVRLTLTRGELVAQFYTGDAAARDALAASLPQLREALAQHNIWLGQANVFLGQDERTGHAPYTWTGRGGFGWQPGGGAEVPLPEANARADYDARLVNYLV